MEQVHVFSETEIIIGLSDRTLRKSSANYRSSIIEFLENFESEPAQNRVLFIDWVAK